MTRAEFAKPVAEEMGVPLVTILTALAILAQNLPAIIELCSTDNSMPRGMRIKQLCMNHIGLARWEIFKTLPRDTTRKHRWRVAERVRIGIITTLPEHLEEMVTDVPD